MTELAEKSGDFIRPYFGRADLVVETKSDATPVTLADRGAEELMRKLIKAKFPTHGIIGEELGSERPDAEFVWILDPIDGTKSFITGVPLWGTLIALLHRGQPVLGVIHQPILKQLMTGDGTTTTLNGRAVRVRATKRIEDATLLTSDPFNPSKYQNGDAFNALHSGAPPPTTRSPSGSSSASTPIARKLATTTAIRSLSLTRSSAAPEMTVSPRARAATPATARR